MKKLSLMDSSSSPEKPGAVLIFLPGMSSSSLYSFPSMSRWSSVEY